MTRRRHRSAALAVAVLLTLTSCGGTSEDAGTASDEPAAEKSSPESERTEDTPDAPAQATCTLKGEQTAMVTLEDTGAALVATFEGQPVTNTGTILYSVTAFDESGEAGRQLGMKYLDGEQSAYFVFDYAEAEQVNLEGSPEADGDTVRGTFPDEALGDLAEAGVASWSAAFNVEGDDVGVCPGGLESLPFPG